VEAARLKAKYSTLLAPDALRLATACRHRSDLFFSNDDTLKKAAEINTFTVKDI